MSRILIAALFCFVFAVPMFAQTDFPRVQVGMGYSNLGLPSGTGTTTHRSGFAMQTGFNLTRWFGIENYTGFHSLGSGSTLISNVVGGKLMGASVLGGRFVPYGVAGFGVGYVSQRGYYGSGSMGTARLGLGADVPLNESMGIRVEGVRTSIHSGAWISGWNVTTGIYLNIVRN